jgi:hypothetical protein
MAALPQKQDAYHRPRSRYLTQLERNRPIVPAEKFRVVPICSGIFPGLPDGFILQVSEMKAMQ